MIKLGDTIGIIALGGSCDKNILHTSITNFQNLGFNIKLSKNIFEENRYLAGSDKDKISELESFFKNPEIKLILNARGGYGSIRLINQINYDIIKNNPKPFCGFSDITALLLMIYKKCNLITYHSPMLCSDFSQEKPINFTYQNFLKAINEDNLNFKGNKVYKNGFAEGIIWGGNLSTVTSLCGQDFIPDKNFIFFTEDLNEPAYKIDKMFTQLFNINNFKNNCKGIILGDFLNIDNPIWLEDFFQELAEKYNIPLIGGFKITHNTEKITLPIGKKCVLNSKNLTIF